MSNDLIPVADVERMARAIAASKLFGVQSPDQAMALMLIAQAEGRHPAIAARDYHIIQGRPALKADAILARFQESGGRVEWHKYAADGVEATFTHPQGGSLRIGWTMADARSAGLGSKDVWKQYPRAMLRARVISEAVRTVYPAVLCGFFTPEEVGDFDTRPGSAGAVVRDMGLAEIVRESQTELSVDHGLSIDDVRQAVRDAVARVGRQEVIAQLASLGYTKAEEIPGERRPDVVAMLNGLTVPEAA